MQNEKSENLEVTLILPCMHKGKEMKAGEKLTVNKARKEILKTQGLIA